MATRSPPGRSTRAEVAEPLSPILASLPCAVAVVDETTRYVRAINNPWRHFAERYGAGLPGSALETLFPSARELLSENFLTAGGLTRRAVPAIVPAAGVATWWDLDLALHPDASGMVIVIARDVTEDILARREADEAHKELTVSDARLVLAQEATGIGIWEWNLATDTQAWSPAQFRIFGLDPAHDRPPAFADFIAAVHPNDRASVVAAVEAGFRSSQGAHHLEFRLKRADTGEERWILSLGRTIASAANARPLRLMGVNIDITERRREQEALAASEAKLRLAFEAAQIFTWNWEIATGRVEWMAGLERAIGFAEGGFPGTVDAFKALVHPDDAPHVETAIGKALRGETDHYQAEFRMRRVDGRWRWTTTRALVVRDEAGAPVRMIGVDHDISEWRTAETALRESEGRLRLAMDVAGLGAWEADSRTGRNLWDGALSSLLGLPPTQTAIAPARLFDVVHPDDRAWVQAAYEAAVQRSAPFEAEFCIIRADGVERLFASRGVLAAPGRMVGIAQDITDAREAEALLRESASRFEGMFDSMHQFVALLRPDGTVLKANRAALNFGGLTSEQVIGKKIWDTSWFNSEAARRLRVAVANAATGKFVRYEAELRGVTHNAIIDFSLRPVRDKNGAVVLIVPEGRDISDLKASEAALARSEANYRHLVQTLPLFVFSAHDDGPIDFVTKRWFEYSGQDEEDPLSWGWANALHPDDRERVLAAWRTALSTGEPYQVEERLRGADGSYRWFLTRAIRVPAVTAGNGFRWVGGITDISHIVEAREASAQKADALGARVADHERSLAQAARELEAEIRLRTDLQAKLLQAQKLETMGHLVSSVAHDFNNILTAIIGSYTLIRRRVETPQVLDIVGRGEQAAERATKLTRQLLTFTRQEKPTPEMLDLPELLHDLEDMIGHAIGQDVACTIETSTNVWPVLADGHQLGIALLNLAVNGRDAMPSGGTLTLSARNLLDVEVPVDLPRGQYIAIAVRDTGEGMAPDVLAKAQEAFFTTKPQGKGTGLGLPMVRDCARQAGGVLRIRSALGAGTTVEIILPRAAMVTSTPARAAAVNEISAPSVVLHGHATILMVEDDDQVRPLNVEYLRSLGYTVVEAANAEAAMAVVHTLPRLDLLITDVAMPGDSGIGLARRLRVQWPDLPVLYVTGRQSNPALHDEMVLMKPYRDTALARAVLKRLGRQVTVDLVAAEPLLSRLRNSAMRRMLVDWHTIKAEGDGFPSPGSLDPANYGLDAYAFIAVMEQSKPPLFHYLSIGKGLLDELSRHQGGELVSQEAEGDTVLGTLDGAYRRCVRTAAPLFQASNYDFGDGKPFHFERLILPASDNGQTITHLIGIVLFDTQPDEKNKDDRTNGEQRI
jgi:PAS domain S-box-containing protein